jgi:hypothetical protein
MGETATVCFVLRARRLAQMAPFFLSKLVAELPVVCGFPVLFAAVMYPMSGLQVRFPT